MGARWVVQRGRCRGPDQRLHSGAMADTATAEPSTAPGRATLVLLALILVAAVANLNLAVANVALPDIGKAFDSSQTALDLVAVGYSLGLAASVLWLGALGDRYGRKMMLIFGVLLSIPACLAAAWAGSIGVLIGARIVGGISAGMAYPTTLALIAALWSGPARTKSIALWSALGGAIAALGPLVAGALLQHFWWGSVFLVTLPLAAVALILAVLFVPSHVNETTEPVDNLGGVLSALMVGGLILAINFAPVPNETKVVVGLVGGGDRRRHRVLHQAEARRGTALRPRHRVASRLLGGGMRGHHRLRLADGCDVRRAAVPAERAGLLEPRGRCRDHPGGALHGPDRAAVGQARRSERRSHHVAHRLRLLLPRLPHDVGALERSQPLLAHRPRLCVHRRRRRLRRHARVALTHRFGAGVACRHGVGNRRPPARPRRRHHAIDHGRAADGWLCDCDRDCDRGLPGPEAGHRSSPGRAREVVRERICRPPSSIRSTRHRSSPRPGSRSSTARSGRTAQDSSP